MRDGDDDPTQASDGLLQRASSTDVILLVVVVGVIVAAVLFRGTHSTERAAPANSGAAAATVPGGRAGGALPFVIPGAREDVKRDLRNLVTAQEVVFSDSNRYVDDVSLFTRERGLVLTSGATIRIVWASAAGWAATAEGGRLGGGSCVIRLGAVPDSLRPRTRIQHREGEEAMPRCDGDP